MNIKLNRESEYPLYRQLYDALIAMIHSGEYAPNDTLPSEKMFQRDLGINHLTIRKALRLLESDGYIYKVRGKGTFVAEGRHFLGDKQDESVSRIIGLTMPEALEDSYMQKTKRSIADFFYRRGIHVLVMSCSDPLEQRKKLEHNIKLLSGVIVHASVADEHYPKLIELAEIAEIPIVLAGNLAPNVDLGVDHALSDDRQGAIDAVMYFLENGHSRILFATLENYANRRYSRRLGYDQAMKLAGIQSKIAVLRQDRQTDVSNFNCEDLIDALNTDGSKTAILAENDVIAKNIYKEITRLEMRMPEEIELIGFGNDLWNGEYSTHGDFPLSTVDVPWREIGTVAAESLFARMNGDATDVKRPMLSTRIIHRTTTRNK